MHLHWKHRELVKIIYKARNKLDLEQTAKMLEYESGGILVGTLPTSKGQAIIVYRGKNYSRPPELRPRSLLTKRQALKRSIELQRQEVCTIPNYMWLDSGLWKLTWVFFVFQYLRAYDVRKASVITEYVPMLYNMAGFGEAHAGSGEGDRIHASRSGKSFLNNHFNVSVVELDVISCTLSGSLKSDNRLPYSCMCAGLFRLLSCFVSKFKKFVLHDRSDLRAVVLKAV